MQNGLVSVVIPTYNRAHAVGRAIESALAQDYAALEVIVVDDGSRDETAQVLRKYEGNPRVRCLFKANGGVASARTTGIAAAQGEFIAFLDSDDWFMPGKISLQVECLRRLPEANLIWSDMNAVDAQGALVSPRFLRKMYGTYRFFPKPLDLYERELEGPGGARLYFGDIFSPIVIGNIIHTSTLLARTERVRESGGYDARRFPPRKPGEDHDFHLRICALGPVAFVDQVTVNYVVGAGDAITNPENNLVISLSHLEHLEHALKVYGDRVKLPRGILTDALADSYGWAGQAHYYDGQHAKARGYLLRSLGYRPLRAERWKFLIACLIPKTVIAALLRKGE